MHSNSSDVNPGVDFADFFFFAFLLTSPAGGSFVIHCEYSSDRIKEIHFVE